jgi:hypothetical protein
MRTPSSSALSGPMCNSRVPSVKAAHRLNGVHDQVEDHLLELDPISLNVRPVICQLPLNGDAVFHSFAVDQGNDFKDSIVDIERVSSQRLFLHEAENPTKNVACSIGVFDHALNGLFCFLDFGLVSRELTQSGKTVAHHCGKRLSEFMANRSREFPYRCHAVGVRQLHLHFAILPFATGIRQPLKIKETSSTSTPTPA